MPNRAVFGPQTAISGPPKRRREPCVSVPENHGVCLSLRIFHIVKQKQPSAQISGPPANLNPCADPATGASSSSRRRSADGGRRS